MEQIADLIAKTGIWCVTAYLIGKRFMDYIKSDREQSREDTQREREQSREDRQKEREHDRVEKDRLYSVIENQSMLMQQQKELLGQQLVLSEHNKEMLDKLTEIQILHTNRLDRIEDRLGRLEDRASRVRNWE